MATVNPVTFDTPITIKIQIEGSTRKFKLPLRDLNSNVLPEKLRLLLGIPADQAVIFERFSDSAGAFVTLDPANSQVYKTLFRAAKAKLKLRMRAILVSDSQQPSVPSVEAPPAAEVIPSGPPVAPVPLPVRFLPPPPAPSVSCRSAPTLNPGIETLLACRPKVDKVATTQKDHKNHANKENEAPLPRPFPIRNDVLAELANLPSSWSVYCNACDKPMEDEHYHCSICDNGDYDLCSTCVDSGIHCPGESHWLIKRFVKDGTVINSTTERIAPKRRLAENEMPGAFTEDKKVEAEPEPEQAEIATRTCNSCVKVLPENDFVTCTTCEDYDLCITCHIGSKHGHHPGHGFKPATIETDIGALAKILCPPGRNLRHAAVCDGCDKFIYGVRHKCLSCPDFDFCSKCIRNARYIHPVHRFVPIYEPLPESRHSTVRHHGIYCDGPLCKAKEQQTYIEGVRYKCAVCHDTDFCANCEAIPHNRHNRTHPLIKFKTPVRNVSVTTMGEDKNGAPMAPMGDHPARGLVTAEPRIMPNSVNAATQVQTIMDVKPTEEAPPKPAKEKIEIRDLLAEPVQQKIKVADLLTAPTPEVTKAATPDHDAQPATVPEPATATATATATSVHPFTPTEFNAHFVRDAIPDGSELPTSMVFTQIWTLRNPGPHDWPAGCSVRYVGGDNMLNVDDSHPSSAEEIAGAIESNTTVGPVKAGEEVEFFVRMKAPKREGTAISYWRLKTSDGTPFGHRLWCHINVVSKIPDIANIPEPLRQQVSAWKMNVEAREYNERLMKVAGEQERKQVADLANEMHLMKLESDTAKEVEEKTVPSATASSSSTMIFPQLEKESPIASTHDLGVPDNEATRIEPAPSTPSDDQEKELQSLEDDDLVEIMDASSDDGFLTDEEYDILDASDEDRA